MKTEWIKINYEADKQQDLIKQAAIYLKNNELVAFPTETVYGLGANALNETAVEQIFIAKGRPGDNPLIVHLADPDDFNVIAERIPPYVQKLVEVFSPGPLTYVLPARAHIPKVTTGGLNTIGLRIPNHPVALALIKESGVPIAAPSANTSGKPSPTNAQHVLEDLDGKISAVVDAGTVAVGLESTVLDCTGEHPMILRPGSITKAMLEEVVGRVDIDQSLTSEAEKPRSPGMKYRHYAPEVPLVLLPREPEQVNQLLQTYHAENKRVVLIGRRQFIELFEVENKVVVSENLAEVARHLYDYLRTYKKTDVDVILFETFPKEGIGEALMNRLTKAAGDH